ncbi:hypothetical protein GE061_004783 [Apolygus lucorum]|uniref:RNA cytidine acetyltransferase n=1 Tax=Apolygus lucorum TaxID=248454 RepID=A0A8S9X1N4_APOLU|nr:hypothetical protein GE061_004783 [Apolygus lucorum]
MTRTKIDNRIRTLIENGIKLHHRTMFVVVGDKGRDQVMILHHILSKATVKSRPSVLWCYKSDLGFTTNHKKRMKKVQKKIKGGKLNINEDDPFELFVASTNIRYCYYSETQKILGQTFGMCVLQDFEAITPNLLARTIETVEGGGVVVMLVKAVSSLKQLYNLTMDVHDRYRTEAHAEVVGRFNERFLLSLSDNDRCIVVDDKLTVLPISSHIYNVAAIAEPPPSTSSAELKEVQQALRDTPPIGPIVDCCKTSDQAKAVLKCIDAISEKSYKFTISITAARGRGKSAALGLSVAAAVAFGYSNIFVTSPSPDNLKTFFEFVFKGFDALGYEEHVDYGLVQSTNVEHNKALIRVNVFKSSRQTIQYISPVDYAKLSHAELVVIDEAAAIPLPYVKNMFGPYLIFLSSTINGYEGTGRSLSLKLLQELRNQTNAPETKNVTGRVLYEVKLEESIRYQPGDRIEKWLTDLLCLDATNSLPSFSGTPPPSECELYYINRDTLFCYHKASEAFLQKIMALYVSSHYKNSPNDLQLMSDAPAHHLFCLLGPVDVKKPALPETLCVIQVCLEGQVSRDSVKSTLSQGRKPSGDLIPWTIAQQFQDSEFPSLCGARIVRIATHPDYQSMGYGSKALELLKDYYEFKFQPLDDSKTPYHDIDRDFNNEDVDLLSEKIEPRSSLPPLLLKLHERPAERLDYLGVSYGLTLPLLKFWKRAGFVPVYVRQTPNEVTGEHSTLMLKTMDSEVDSSWLQQYSSDFRRRFLSLLSYQFREFPTSLSLAVCYNKRGDLCASTDLTTQVLEHYITKYDLKRLDLYCKNLADYHLIMDLLPSMSKMFFLNQLGDTKLSAVQAAILLGIGMQHKTVDVLAKELELVPTQLLGLFNKIIRKLYQVFMSTTEHAIEESLGLKDQPEAPFVPKQIGQGLMEELDSADRSIKKKQKLELERLKEDFEIKGSDDAWEAALKDGGNSILSIRSERPASDKQNKFDFEPPKKKKKSFHKKGGKK